MGCTPTGCSSLPQYVRNLKPKREVLKKLADSISTHASIPLSVGLTMNGCNMAEAQLITAMSVVICDFFLQGACTFVDKKVGNPFEKKLSDSQWQCIVKNLPKVATTIFSYHVTLIISGGYASKNYLYDIAKLSTCFIAAKFSQFFSEKYSDKMNLAEEGYARSLTRFIFTFIATYDVKHALDYFFNQDVEDSTVSPAAIPTTSPTTVTPTTEFSSTKPIIEGAEDGNDWHLDETVENNVEDYDPSNGFDVYEYEKKLVEQVQAKARKALDVSSKQYAIPMRNTTTNSTITEEEFFDALETIQN